LIVRVKYCGGCYSSYDRPAFVERLASALPSVEFVYAGPEGPEDDAKVPDFVLAMCGCSVRCAGKGGETGARGSGKFVAWSEADFPAALEALKGAFGL
jgi:hypothetical protein